MMMIGVIFVTNRLRCSIDAGRDTFDGVTAAATALLKPIHAI